MRKLSESIAVIALSLPLLFAMTANALAENIKVTATPGAEKGEMVYRGLNAKGQPRGYASIKCTPEAGEMNVHMGVNYPTDNNQKKSEDALDRVMAVHMNPPQDLCVEKGPDAGTPNRKAVLQIFQTMNNRGDKITWEVRP